MSHCICCNRPAKFLCRYCDETCCEWCYYGPNPGATGHKWRCSYHEEEGPYAEGPHVCDQPRCPDPPECDHGRLPDNQFGEGGRDAYLKR